MAQTTHHENYPANPTLYTSIELSSKTWRLALSAGGRKIRQRKVPFGALSLLRREVEEARRGFRLPVGCRVLFVQEAGRDAFWIHRELEGLGWESLVIDAASVRVNRKSRRPKTDRIDAKLLVSELVRYNRYDASAWSVVRVPSREAEDQRRPTRELRRLINEKTQHEGRIRSLLIQQGIKVSSWSTLEERLDGLRSPAGQGLPPRLKLEVGRELERLKLVKAQIEGIKKEQEEEVKAPKTKRARVAAKLQRLKGIGIRISTVTAAEVFSWRTFRNRKEVGAFPGLCGNPYNTGISVREQGIGKVGNRQLRALLIEAAWCWVRWQPDSDITQWYQRRWAHDPRRKKAGIVAVARRLLIQLWHYVEHDVMPKGAIFNS